MKTSVMKTALFALLAIVIAGCAKQGGRDQWTEEEAWAWQERVGVIKGFNEPYPAYPGQTRLEILQKAKELGFNSVRKWINGETSEEMIANLQSILNDAEKCGMTVSPVFANPRNAYREALKNNDTIDLKKIEDAIRPVLRHFANEDRIVFWDLWNEPRFEDNESTYEQMDI
ncbi:MAG: cellulase family glycosylhydrolase, partial [Muribaculaceae bacterium]|nr:cellulase family glycosylhydrolase [Muribaculaceae bacterium]